MRKFGNSLALKKSQAEWLIRTAIRQLNAANEVIVRLVAERDKEGYDQLPKQVIETYELIMAQTITKRKDAINTLTVMLDISDRQALGKAFGRSDLSVNFEDNDSFEEWLLISSIHYRIELDTYVPFRNEITFSVVKLS